MGLDKPGIKRRTFLKQGAVAGLGALAGAAWTRTSWSASKERLMILSSIGLDTLHPYAHSSGPQYGIWQHMIEPLVEINYARKDYYGVLAESWKFQGNTWVFRLRKGIRFHHGSPFTAQDVIHSVNRIRSDCSKIGLTSCRVLPSSTWRVKASEKIGSMPPEQPAMMEIVPVGAIVT